LSDRKSHCCVDGNLTLLFACETQQDARRKNNLSQLRAEYSENNEQASYLAADYIRSSKFGSAVFHNVVHQISNGDSSVLLKLYFILYV
jgi:hypothetical protein